MPPGPLWPDFILEDVLQRELHQARIAHLRHLPKLRAIAAVAIRVQELRVIEGIKKFGAKLEVRTFSYWDQLVNGEINVCDPGAATDGALGISDSAQQAGIVVRRTRIRGVFCKDVRIEPVPAIVPWVLRLERRQLIRSEEHTSELQS